MWSKSHHTGKTICLFSSKKINVFLSVFLWLTNALYWRIGHHSTFLNFISKRKSVIRNEWILNCLFAFGITVVGQRRIRVFVRKQCTVAHEFSQCYCHNTQIVCIHFLLLYFYLFIFSHHSFFSHSTHWISGRNQNKNSVNVPLKCENCAKHTTSLTLFAMKFTLLNKCTEWSKCVWRRFLISYLIWLN